MTASEKTTERAKKVGRSKRKTLNSCFLPSSLCSSYERVPCDLPDPTLRLTEGTAALFISPLTWLYAPPSPPTSPSLRCQEEKMVGRGSGGATSRIDSPSGFSSVPGHCTLLAGILFCLHTHMRAHTRAHTHISMQKQMTINGYDNVVWVFLAAQSHDLF